MAFHSDVRSLQTSGWESLGKVVETAAVLKEAIRGQVLECTFPVYLSASQRQWFETLSAVYPLRVSAFSWPGIDARIEHAPDRIVERVCVSMNSQARVAECTFFQGRFDVF